MSSRVSWTSAPLLLLALLAAPVSSAWAQSKQDGCLKDTVCRDAYYKALKLFDEAKSVEALDGFQGAYNRRQMPWLLLNIGRTVQRLGRPQEAISYYERYKKAEPNIDAATLDRVNKYIEQAKALLETTPTDPKPPEPNPAGQTPATGDPNAKPATTTPANPQLVPAQALTTPPTPAVDTPKETPLYKKWWFWTIVGVAVAGGVAAGVGAAAASKPTVVEPFLPTDPVYMPNF